MRQDAASFANETFAIALTDELPTTLVGRLISEVASQGEHRDLAWNFVKANFTELTAKQGPSFSAGRGKYHTTVAATAIDS